MTGAVFRAVFRAFRVFREFGAFRTVFRALVAVPAKWCNGWYRDWYAYVQDVLDADRPDLDLVTIVFQDDAVDLGGQLSVVGFTEVEVHPAVSSSLGSLGQRAVLLEVGHRHCDPDADAPDSGPRH
jgi:hypothetical protein